MNNNTITTIKENPIGISINGAYQRQRDERTKNHIMHASFILLYSDVKLSWNNPDCCFWCRCCTSASS